MCSAVFSFSGFVVNRAFSLTAHDTSHVEEAARAMGQGVGSSQKCDGEAMGIGEFSLRHSISPSKPGLYWYTKSGLTWDEETRVREWIRT